MKMREEKDKTGQPDDFSDYIRRRLEEHRLPVDADGWEGLEARMKRKPLSERWWWGGCLAAVGVLLLAVWIMPVPEEMPGEGSSVTRGTVAGGPGERPSSSGPVIIPGEKGSPARGVIARAIMKEPAVRVETPEVAIAEEPEIVIAEMPLPGRARKTGATVPLPDGYRNDRVEEVHKEEIRKTRREGKRWQLAAAVGSAGYAARPLGMGSNDTMGDDYPMQDPDKDPDDDKDDKPQEVYSVNGGQTGVGNPYTRIATDDLLDRPFESYPEVRYSMPISFGFTVRKRLNKQIGVETGLVYTYLSTLFRQAGMCRTEVRSRLHYLGIPVNLVVNLWDHPKWNVYLSGGVMMEKGIQAVYEERKTWTDRVDSRSAREGIDGLQWSANASVGAAYRVYRDWSLYLEPRFSYYFDAGQPVSVRTDKPLGFGLNAGIRFEF